MRTAYTPPVNAAEGLLVRETVVAYNLLRRAHRHVSSLKVNSILMTTISHNMLRPKYFQTRWYLSNSCVHNSSPKSAPLVSPRLSRFCRYISRPTSRRLYSQFPKMLSRYNWISGVERLEFYEPGGYHPIMVDDLLYNRYWIVDKLGYGGYSTIWLARDDKLDNYVAIKVNISHSSSSRRECEILRALSSPGLASKAGYTHIPRILDEFDIQGPNGTHSCYTMAPAQGNLKESSFSQLFPIQVARALAAKLTIAVSFVHSQGFVHGGLFFTVLTRAILKLLADMHLQKILIKLPSTFDNLSVQEFRAKFGKPETVPINRNDGRKLTPSVPSEAVLSLDLSKRTEEFTLADAQNLLLNDFGESFAPASEQRLGKDSHIPISKRAPEAFFEPNAPLSYP